MNGFMVARIFSISLRRSHHPKPLISNLNREYQILFVEGNSFRNPARNLSSKTGDYSHNYQVDNLRSSEVEFCPNRARDVLQSAVTETEEESSYDVHHCKQRFMQHNSEPSAEQLGDAEHVEAYKSAGRGSVSLDAVMQSNVPEPFSSQGKAPTHLNMPGGSWSQEHKYLSEHLQTTHQSRQFSNDSSNDQRFREQQVQQAVHQSGQNDPGKLTPRMKLKMAVRDYGSTVIVFHVAISLVSLGSCYLLVKSGLDVAALLSKLNISAESLISSNVAVGGSQFVIAYAMHKVLMPVRIGITLTATPIIVRYLRRVGFLKAPKTAK